MKRGIGLLEITPDHGRGAKDEKEAEKAEEAEEAEAGAGAGNRESLRSNTPGDSWK